MLLALVIPLAAANAAAQETAPARSQTPPAPDISQIPVSLDRIKKGVEREEKLRIDFLNPNWPVFRIEVQERDLELEDYWRVRDTAVAPYVQSSFGSTLHHEFLSMVTPKQHIAASPFGVMGNPVHPVGVPWLAIGRGIGKLRDNIELARIRRQIQAELKALEEGQPRPKEPGPPN